MFKDKRTLFVRVALETGLIRAGGESGLFRFKSPVRVVTIAAFHMSFQHFVAERFVELGFGFTVAGDAKLLFAGN